MSGNGMSELGYLRQANTHYEKPFATVRFRSLTFLEKERREGGRDVGREGGRDPGRYQPARRSETNRQSDQTFFKINIMVLRDTSIRHFSLILVESHPY